MLFVPGSTSQSITIQIVNDSGLAVTGLVAAGFPTVLYKKAGPSLPANITLVDLALVSSPWVSGGVKEISGGYYRLDLPDAVFAVAGGATIIGDATGKHLVCPPVDVHTPELTLPNGVETNWTLQSALRIVMAALAGKTSNGQTIFRDLNDTKNRIVASVASDSDRETVTLDAT